MEECAELVTHRSRKAAPSQACGFESHLLRKQRRQSEALEDIGLREEEGSRTESSRSPILRNEKSEDDEWRSMERGFNESVGRKKNPPQIFDIINNLQNFVYS